MEHQPALFSWLTSFLEGVFYRCRKGQKALNLYLILPELNMLGIDEYKAFANAAFIDAFLDICCDVDKSAARGHVEPEFFAITFHGHPSLGNEYKELSVAALKP